MCVLVERKLRVILVLFCVRRIWKEEREIKVVSYVWKKRGSTGMRDGMETENRQVDPAMQTIIRSLVERIK